jgi:hypothetical protein
MWVSSCLASLQNGFSNLLYSTILVIKELLMETETDREDEAPEAGQADLEGEGKLDGEPEVQPEARAEAEPRHPSVVINVYSWATPIVGVLMLAVGLLAGYFGRPLIASKAEPTLPAAAVQSANPTEEAQRQEMMTFLVSQVKHFKGDPNAPVTIIEFSDYQ